MRRLLIILSFLLSFHFSFSQVWVNRSTPSVTAVDARVKFSMNLIIPVLADTLLLNQYDSLGILLQIRNTGAVYIRDTNLISGGHKWSKFLKQGDVTTQRFGIEDALGIQNRYINMKGFDLWVDSSDYIELDAIQGANTNRLLLAGASTLTTSDNNTNEATYFNIYPTYATLNTNSSLIPAKLIIPVSSSLAVSSPSGIATFDNDTLKFTSILPIARGGTGTATPSLVQGTNITITGTWPNQTINASGGGSGINNTNVGSGFRILNSPGAQTLRTLFSSNTIIWDSASNTNGLTAKADTSLLVTSFRLRDTAAAILAAAGNITGSLTAGRVTLSMGATTIGDDGGLTFDTTTNELTTDSTSVIQHRADYLTLNAVNVIDTLRTFGNSITAGSNADPIIDSSYVNRTGRFLEKPVGNYAIPGRGSVTAISQHYIYTPLLNSDMSLVMVGFNDIRRNNVFGANGYKTLNKIINAHKSIFLNHFLKSFVAAGSGSITRYGSWVSPWDARNEAGKTGNGAFTSTLNDSAVYSFTDSTIGIGLIGGDGEGSTYSVYVDNVLSWTGTTFGQYDGISDGFPGNTRAPLCVVITGLTYAAHTVKIVNTSANLLILDYFGHLRDAATATPLVILHAPYMNAAGYAQAPNSSSVAATNEMNDKLDSLIASFPIAYQSHVFRIATNTCYDTLTGLDFGDNIHPNNTGHRQIFQCVQAALTSDAQPLGSIYFSNDAFYGITSSGAARFFQGTGLANYIPKFTDINKLGLSIIQDDGTNVGISQAPATYKLSVAGSLRNTTDAYFATTSGSVGVGTIAPNYKMEVNGTFGATGVIQSNGLSSGFALTNRNTGANEWSIFAGTPSLNFYHIPTNFERVKMWARGGVTIAYATETNIVDEGRGLAIHGSMSIEKDSVTIAPSTTGMYVLLLDTTATIDSNRVKRILASSLGNGITSINSESGPAITIATGTSGTNFAVATTTNTITLNLPDAGTSARGAVTSSPQTFGGQKTFNDGLIAQGNTITSSARIHVTGNNSPFALGTITASNMLVDAMTHNDGSTAGSGTITNNVGFNYWGIPTLTATNSSVTYTDVSNLKFEEPVAGSNISITHPRSIYAKGIGTIEMLANGIVESSAGTATLGKASHFIATGTTVTLTLPDLALYKGAIYYIKNAASGNITLNAAGSDTIFDTSSVTSITIGPGLAKIIVAGTAWYVE